MLKRRVPMQTMQALRSPVADQSTKLHCSAGAAPHTAALQSPAPHASCNQRWTQLWQDHVPIPVRCAAECHVKPAASSSAPVMPSQAPTSCSTSEAGPCATPDDQPVRSPAADRLTTKQQSTSGAHLAVSELLICMHCTPVAALTPRSVYCCIVPCTMLQTVSVERSPRSEPCAH